ncbi:MAG: thiamine-phosphate kinase [Alphaproteobacteria bacterium]|nr:thiamine-phosphate kinase [Alphaproteobacteria bacterium]
MKRRAPRPGEFELIARHLAPLARGEKGAFGLLDDAALIAPRAGHAFVVTADAVVEGVHFLRADPPDLVARKALRVNLSDLAAKGARPRCYFMTTSWPDWVDGPWVEAFARGLGVDQAAFGIHLAGGDTTRMPGPLSISITAVGEVRGPAMVRRSGAKVGDEIWVTGSIGDAFLGLKVARDVPGGLSASDRETLLGRYRLPEPRVAAGLGLAGIASAAIDVSDGLVADIAHLARASGLTVEIRAADVPLSAPALRAVGTGLASVRDLLSGGDDYEIAFTAPPGAAARIRALSRRTGVPITCIGSCHKGAPDVVVRAADGRPVAFPRAGFTHF